MQFRIGTSQRSFRFFFQAEDGIRDVAVTGVQTCALPISFWSPLSTAWRGGQGVRQKRNGPASVGSGPDLRRACRLQPSRASSDAGNHSATTASAPRRARTHHPTGRTTAGGRVVRDHEFAIYPACAAVSTILSGG